jgi:hypothetical protein
MHHWQDFVLSAGALLFIVALVPTILSKHKPALSSCIMTGSILSVFALVYVTLHLWYAAATTAGTAVTWAILAAQNISQMKKTKPGKSEV